MRIKMQKASSAVPLLCFSYTDHTRPKSLYFINIDIYHIDSETSSIVQCPIIKQPHPPFSQRKQAYPRPLFRLLPSSLLITLFLHHHVPRRIKHSAHNNRWRNSHPPSLPQCQLPKNGQAVNIQTASAQRHKQRAASNNSHAHLAHV